jgi:hypothetical protein
MSRSEQRGVHLVNAVHRMRLPQYCSIRSDSFFSWLLFPGIGQRDFDHFSSAIGSLLRPLVFYWCRIERIPLCPSTNISARSATRVLPSQ